MPPVQRFTRFLSHRAHVGGIATPTWVVALAGIMIAAAAGQAIGPALARSVVGTAELSAQQQVIIDASGIDQPSVNGASKGVITLNDEGTAFTVAAELSVGSTMVVEIPLANSSGGHLPMLAHVDAPGMSTALSAATQGFTGAFAPGNWSQDLFTDSEVDVFDSATFRLIGPDSGSGQSGRSEVSVIVPAAGDLTFEFVGETQDSDGWEWDAVEYSIDGDLVQLSPGSGFDAVSGTVTVAVDEGDIFAFSVSTVDDVFGPAILTVTNFSFAGEAPVQVAQRAPHSWLFVAPPTVQTRIRLLLRLPPGSPPGFYEARVRLVPYGL